MNLAEQQIIFAGETLILTNQRVLYWPQSKALILSDLHLGKAAHFRKNGIPIPVQTSLQDINRLEFLLNYYRPQKLIIVGDLLHAGQNHEFHFFKKLRIQNTETDFILVKGNHDRADNKVYQDLGIDDIFDKLIIDSVCFSHQLIEYHNLPTISGHMHPGIRIKLPTGNVSLPCYLVGYDRLILPAFSTFTGLDTSYISSQYNIYGLDKEKIYKIRF